MAQTILLLEDDRSLREGLRDVLVSEGYEVRAADCLAAARQAFASGGVDLFILDVMLPDGSGIELLRALRTSSAAPALFLTACDDELSAVQGLDAGGDDYVTKPFRLRELLSRIRALLRRAGSGDSTEVLAKGPLSLALTNQTASYQGADVRLTPTECALLALFIKHPGQVLTRQQLLDSLWDGAGAFVDDNNLSVHVGHLRDKLPGIGIGTVRGVGYRWDGR